MCQEDGTIVSGIDTTPTPTPAPVSATNLGETPAPVSLISGVATTTGGVLVVLSIAAFRYVA